MRLGRLFRRWRAAEEYGLRDVAAEIGISASTLSRLENGKGIDAESFAKILLWLMGKGSGGRT